MEFEKGDWDWSDWHHGLSVERQRRYHALTEEIARRVTGIVARYHLLASVPEGIFSTGVQGDERTYTPIVMLIGKMPDYDVLEKISSEITNTMPVNRVVISIAVKDPKTGEAKTFTGILE